jgi:adenosylcobinamide-GDP ribazoletransferase
MPVARAVHTELRGAAAALAFLTRLPVGALVPVGATDLARSAPAFPVVGAALGAVVAGSATLLAGPCPPLVAAAGALAVGVTATGAIHLDALADTADALGARARDRALEVMRDPRIGAYGGIAIALVLIVEAGALAAPDGSVASVVAAFALSRAVAPGVACVLPYARPGAGLGRSLTDTGKRRAIAAAAVGAAIAWALAPSRVLALVCAAGLCWLAAVAVCHRSFGGVTGDTLGATVALTEAICLAVAVSG